MRQTDSAFDSLKNDPTAARLLSDPAALKSLLSAPETQKLLSLLNSAGGDSLSSAAQAAALGKPDALMGILNQVTSTQEGTQAMEALKNKTRQ